MKSMMTEELKDYRQIKCRLHVNDKEGHYKLKKIADACRWVWNYFHALNLEEYKEYKRKKELAEAAGVDFKGKPPSVTFHSLGVKFTQLRKKTPQKLKEIAKGSKGEPPNLAELPYAIVRYTLDAYAKAWKAFFKKHNARAGMPRFKKFHDTKLSFAIPENVKIKDNKIFIPKTGWFRFSRHHDDEYADCPVVSARIYNERNRWYLVLCHEIPQSERPKVIDESDVIGIDVNSKGYGHIAVCYHDEKTEIIKMPESKKLKGRENRYRRKIARQRERNKHLVPDPYNEEKKCEAWKLSKRREKTKKSLATTTKKKTDTRQNWQHQISNKLRDYFIVIEDLKPENMSRSAKGTKEKPGKNVNAKKGLNRANQTAAIGSLPPLFEYKSTKGVLRVDPKYTSQTCSACGNIDKKSRKGERYKCVACGYTENADINACINIRRKGMKILQDSDLTRPTYLGQLDGKGVNLSGENHSKDDFFLKFPDDPSTSFVKNRPSEC